MLSKGKAVFLVVAVLLILLCVCGKTATVSNCSIYHDTEEGGVYVNQTIDDFNALKWFRIH